MQIYSLLLSLLFIVTACSTSPPPKEDGVIRIVAIGDSITKGLTAPEHRGHQNTIEGGWVARLDQKLFDQFGGRVEIFNEGVTGDTTFGLFERLQGSLYDYDADLIILGIGTNDINSNWMGGLGRLFIGESMGDVGSFSAAMREIFEGIRSNTSDPDVFIVGMSVPLQKYWSETFWGFSIKMPEQSAVRNVYTSYNRALENLSLEFGFTFIDIAAYWPADPDESWNYYADGIHPNDRGYNLMSTVIHRATTGSLLSKIKTQ